MSLRGTVIVWYLWVTVTDNHRVNYANVIESLRSCVLYDRVYVYYMIELFKLFCSIFLVVHNFTDILKPKNVNIIQT